MIVDRSSDLQLLVGSNACCIALIGPLKHAVTEGDDSSDETGIGGNTGTDTSGDGDGDGGDGDDDDDKEEPTEPIGGERFDTLAISCRCMRLNFQ